VPIARGRHVAAQDIRHPCSPRPPDRRRQALRCKSVRAGHARGMRRQWAAMTDG
jgi:hypothetical protein